MSRCVACSPSCSLACQSVRFNPSTGSSLGMAVNPVNINHSLVLVHFGQFHHSELRRQSHGLRSVASHKNPDHWNLLCALFPPNLSCPRVEQNMSDNRRLYAKDSIYQNRLYLDGASRSISQQCFLYNAHLPRASIHTGLADRWRSF